MKCYKCGKEGSLKRGLCIDCYKEILHNKYKKRKKQSPFKMGYILNNLERNEKIICKAEISTLIYIYIVSLFAISIILFPKTIMEFFVNKVKAYFLIFSFNVILFALATYLTLYFLSRDIYLTDRKIIGKWGIFKIKKLNVPLNNLISIDTYQYTGLEIDTKNKNYFFDFVGNSDKFKLSTIMQIKNIINSTESETVLNSFSHSLKEKIDNYKFEINNPNMTYCKCCKKAISKESTICVHCGQPVTENERSADLFIKALCFFFPPVGIILFLLNIGPFPKFAKQCLLSSITFLFIILVIYLSLLSIL